MYIRLGVCIAVCWTWGTGVGLAQWTKTIDCPVGTVYRDERVDAGRLEYCERHLPGNLSVQDGPSRSWYSPGRLRDEGTYRNGRQVGRWKECTRFGRCQERDHELLFPSERMRSVEPAIPVVFSAGKYVFDFGACWSTQVTRRSAAESEVLNFNHDPYRCRVFVSHEAAPKPRPPYACEIPHTVGVRELASLDLRTALPKAGLPPFCGPDILPPNYTMPPSGGLAIRGTLSGADTGKGPTERLGATLATARDVECAALERASDGSERLTLRLNAFVEQLLLDRIGKDLVEADACPQRLALRPAGQTTDSSFRTLFHFELSTEPDTSRRQRACIRAEVAVQKTCGR